MKRMSRRVPILFLGVGVMALLSAGCTGPAEEPSVTGPVPAQTTPSTATSTQGPSGESSAPEAAVLALAQAGVTSNAEWTPHTQELDGALMALVPAGCFQMGAVAGNGDERPVHEVCIDEPFWIDVYEVTNEQYGSTGCADFSPDPRQPRNCVSWEDARAHCEARGGRLPTEAEWEYAARGPDELVYPWGDDFNENNAIWGYNSGRHPAEAGSTPQGVSWTGVHDLSGNVWEWVGDWYSETYYATLGESVVNPQGPGGGTIHVRRGGSFEFDEADALRASFRAGVTPAFEAVDDGFRCARSHIP
jgi:formylglycine-generating enzyme required for sulfatase activity